MTSEDFDFEGVFDEDYLYFYDAVLTDERNDREAALVEHLLGVSPDAQILDAPCGHGRIANRLAARGYRVTGIDASDLFLVRARTDATSLGVEVDYQHADLREFDPPQHFDAVVNWFTSFGYFGKRDDLKVLRSFHNALRPGGKLIIETLNRDRFIRSLPDPSMPPRVIKSEVGDDIMTDTIEFDPLEGCTRTERLIVRGGRVRRTHFTVRVFTYPELRDLLLGEGFARVDGFGAEAEPFSLASARLIAVATK